MGIWPKRDPREPRCSPGAPATPRAHVHVPIWPCASASSNTTFTTTSRATSLYVPLVYGFTSQRRPTPIKPKKNRAEDESTHTTFRINDIRAPPTPATARGVVPCAHARDPHPRRRVRAERALSRSTCLVWKIRLSEKDEYGICFTGPYFMLFLKPRKAW